MQLVELQLVVVAVVEVYRAEDGLLGRAGVVGHGGRAGRAGKAGGIDRGRDTKGLRYGYLFADTAVRGSRSSDDLVAAMREGVRR